MIEYRVEIASRNIGRGTWFCPDSRTFADLADAEKELAKQRGWYRPETMPRFRITMRTVTPWKPIDTDNRGNAR